MKNMQTVSSPVVHSLLKGHYEGYLRLNITKSSLASTHFKVCFFDTILKLFRYSYQVIYNCFTASSRQCPGVN